MRSSHRLSPRLPHQKQNIAAAKNSPKNAAVNKAAAGAANNNKSAANKSAPAAMTLLEAISTRSDLTTFTAVLGLVGVDDELDQPLAATTVFAPTNAAMDAFARGALGEPSANGTDLLRDRYFTLLRRVVAAAAGVGTNVTGTYSMFGGQYVRLAPGREAGAMNKAGEVGGEEPLPAAALVASVVMPGGAVETASVVPGGGAIDLGPNGAVYVVDRVLRPADVILVTPRAAGVSVAGVKTTTTTTGEQAAAASGARATNAPASNATPAGSSRNATSATAAAAITRAPTAGAAALLAADPGLSSFSRLAALLAPELLASSAAAPLTLFAPSNAALDAYLSRAHGLATAEAAAKAIESLPDAAAAVEAAAGAAQAALAAMAAEKEQAAAAGALAGPAVAAAAARNAAAAADADAAQRRLQGLLVLRANLTAAVAYHASPGLALDGATLLEGGRLLPTLLAEGPAPPAAALAAAAAAAAEVAAVAVPAAGADATLTPAAAPAAVVVRSGDVPTKMLAAKAGGNGLGAPLLLGDLGSSAAIVGSAYSGDDALHTIDAVLQPSPVAGAPAPEPGTVVEGGAGDVAVPSADGWTTIAMPPALAAAAGGGINATAAGGGANGTSADAAAGARGGFDISTRNNYIQNAMQANIVRAIRGGISVQQAAIRNNYIANLAPYNTPLYYLSPGGGYGGYGGGYWMG